MTGLARVDSWCQQHSRDRHQRRECDKLACGGERGAAQVVHWWRRCLCSMNRARGTSRGDAARHTNGMCFAQTPLREAWMSPPDRRGGPSLRSHCARCWVIGTVYFSWIRAELTPSPHPARRFGLGRSGRRSTEHVKISWTLFIAQACSRRCEENSCWCEWKPNLTHV